MQAERVVGLEADGQRGSGYVIGPDLVLTSAHVAASVVRVCPPASARAFRGVVEWRGTPGGRDDAALVRIDDPGWPALGGKDPSFGRVVTDRPGLSAEAWGFPRWLQRPDRAADTWHLTGVVNPGSRWVGDRLVLSVAGEPPTGASPWSGLSGAAVFCGDLLVGVVANDIGGGGHGHLEVVPVSVLPPLPSRLWPVELAAAQLPEPDQLRSPAALLRAGARVVGFRGRQRLMDDLDVWCSGTGFGALLLHGPGGQGKSRVGYELVERQAAARWATLWLDEEAGDLDAVTEVVVPLLIVVDYAESRPNQVRALLKACARHPGHSPVRLLMLARTAGDWWELLQADRHAEHLLDSAPVTTLPVLDIELPDQLDTYRQAVHDLAATVMRMPRYAGHDWPAIADRLRHVARDVGGQALTVQMQALADLLDVADPVPAGDGQQTVEDRVLVHELRYWLVTADSQNLAMARSTLFDVLALVFLFGATDRDRADRLLCGIAALADQPRDRRDAVREWLAALYPAADGQPWGSLQPDRLAERFAGLRLSKLPTLADGVIPAADERQRRQLLTVLVRAAQHRGLADRLSDQLTDLCVRHAESLTQAAIAVATETETAEPLLAALSRITADQQTPVERLELIADWIPEMSLRLAPWAGEVAQRLVDAYRRQARTDSQTALPRLALALNDLSVRLFWEARHNEALAAIQEAVKILGPLAAERPDEFEPQLARLLTNLSTRLSGLEQHEQALAAMRKAVAIDLRLAQAHPETHLPDLASSMNNLSNRLRDVGQHDNALTAVDEAVGIRRALADEHPEVFLLSLAESLSNRSIHLGALHRHEEGLTVIAEAVAIYRRLVDQRPDANLHLLAEALINLAARFGALGRLDEGLAVCEEAVAINRRLVASRPHAFRHAMGIGLINLTCLLSHLHRHEDALAAINEAVATFRQLARREPEAHRADLEWSINTRRWALLRRREK